MKWRNQVTGVVVESDQQLPYPYVRIPVCDTCGFLAASPGGLASHERTHEAEE